VIVSYIHKEKRKLINSVTVVYSLLMYDCTTFTSRENVLNENAVRTEVNPNH